MHHETRVAFHRRRVPGVVVDAVGVEALLGVRCASIGPITTATLRANGIPVAVEASVYTIPGLVQALLNA